MELLAAMTLILARAGRGVGAGGQGHFGLYLALTAVMCVVAIGWAMLRRRRR